VNIKLIALILIVIFIFCYAFYSSVSVKQYIVTGPVDAHQGLKGLLEVGMTRNEVVSHIGEPVIEAQATGPFREEDNDEYFKGAFARVRFSMNNKVMSIDFLPDETRSQYHIEQRIMLRIRGKTYILDGSTNLTDISSQFRKAKIPFRIDGTCLILNKENTDLFFDNSRQSFSRLSIY